MELEYCTECDGETGNAGRGDGSIYIDYATYEVGPLCDACRSEHWVCEKCDMGVENEKVTFYETHDDCGGNVN